MVGGGRRGGVVVAAVVVGVIITGQGAGRNWLVLKVLDPIPYDCTMCQYMTGLELDEVSML